MQLKAIMAEKTIEKIEESYQMNPEENDAIQKVEDKVFYEEYAENISIQGSTQANGTSTINATGESKEKSVEENSEKSKKINYKEQTDNEQNIPKTPLDPEYKNDIDNAFDKQSNSNNFNDYPIDVDNGCGTQVIREFHRDLCVVLDELVAGLAILQFQSDIRIVAIGPSPVCHI